MKGLIGSFASMSVDDIAAAKDFYINKLGLGLEPIDMPDMLMLQCGAGSRCMVYQKDTHQPATHTVLNLSVEDIEATIDDLVAQGVTLNHDEGTDQKGIMTIGDTKMAWFNDPAGNFISLIQHAPAAA